MNTSAIFFKKIEGFPPAAEIMALIEGGPESAPVILVAEASELKKSEGVAAALAEISAANLGPLD